MRQTRKRLGLKPGLMNPGLMSPGVMRWIGMPMQWTTWSLRTNPWLPWKTRPRPPRKRKRS